MDIKAILERELQDYAGEGANGHGTLTRSEDGREFSIIVHATARQKQFTFMSLSVSIENDLIIIHQDRNDPALADTLMQVGIPREKIILAYMGESVPVGA